MKRNIQPGWNPLAGKEKQRDMGGKRNNEAQFLTKSFLFAS